MRNVLFVIPIFFIFFLFAPDINALEPESICNKMSRSYRGTFIWHGDELIQNVSIRILNCFVNEDGDIIASGRGEYITASGKTKIDIRILINAETLRFEMQEFNSEGNTGFTTDGSHVGTISKNLKYINAVWISGKSGRKGDLFLIAEKVG